MGLNSFFIAVLGFASIVTSSKISFSAAPGTVTPALTSEVTLTCSLHDTSPTRPGALMGKDIKNATETTTNIQFVTSVSILHSGVRVASVTEHHPARSLTQWSSMSVDGGVGDSTAVKVYLNVTLQYPTEEQLGRYECQIHGADPLDDQDVMFTNSLDLTNDAPTITQLMDHIRTLEINSRTHLADMEQDKLVKDGKLAALEQDKLANDGKLADLTYQLTAMRTEHAADYSALSKSLNDSRHIETGTFGCQSLQPGHTHQAVSTKFSSPYTGAPPTVFISVGQFVIDVTTDTRNYISLNGTLSDVDTEGFTYTCILNYSDRSYVLYQGMSWISIPA